MTAQAIRFALCGLLVLASTGTFAGNGHLVHGVGVVRSVGGVPGAIDVINAVYANAAVLTEVPGHDLGFTCELLVYSPSPRPGFDPGRRRVLFDWLLRDAKTSVVILSGRQTTRTDASGWARFKRLDVPAGVLSDTVILVSVMRPLGDDRVPGVRGQCTVSQLEPPCDRDRSTACLGEDGRFGVTAMRDGQPLGVSRVGAEFVVFDGLVRIDVLDQCGAPEVRGFTVETESAVDGIVVEIVDTRSGASGVFFPRAGERLVDPRAFEACP